MPFYLRKAFRVGRFFRLNLSKSGAGVSVGVKGLRASLGPRGNELHGGRYGFYFRQRLAASWLKNPLNTPAGQRALLRVVLIVAGLLVLGAALIVGFTTALR